MIESGQMNNGYRQIMDTDKITRERTFVLNKTKGKSRRDSKKWGHWKNGYFSGRKAAVRNKKREYSRTNKTIRRNDRKIANDSPIVKPVNRYKFLPKGSYRW